MFFVCLEGWFFERVIKNVMQVYCKMNFVVKYFLTSASALRCAQTYQTSLFIHKI